MRPSLRHAVSAIILCASLLLIARPSEAQTGIGPLSKDDDIGIIVGFVAAGAAIGVGIYFLARRPPSITGCAVSGPGGLSLQNEGDQQTYTLIGDTAAIKTGNRIQVSGKKKKKDPSGKRDFLVEKQSKDFGPCKVLPTTT